jgi:hypothetical protein
VELLANAQASKFVNYVYESMKWMKRNEPVQPLKLPSNRPGVGVEDGMFVLLLNFG